MARKLPTFIVSGRQHAGKSTVLQQLLQYTTPEKTAVLGDNSPKPGRIITQPVQATRLGHAAGCSCCNPQLDLPEQVQNLAQQSHYEFLLIETSTDDAPAAIAESLVYEQGSAEIFAMITVVDASTFFNILLDDDSDLAEPLVLEIEFADIIVVNKTDLIDNDTLEKICSYIKILNRSAQILPLASNTNLPATILTHKLFDLESTTERAGWLQALENTTTGQFVFRARRPFHPQRFMDSIERGWPGVFRSKGTIWLATRNSIAGEWSQTGNSCSLEPAGYWFAALDRTDWPDDPETLAWITDNWDEQAGDRRQEIAFLGTNIDLDNLTQSLHACLLTDQEMELSSTEHDQLPDPFPQWEQDID